MDVSLCVLLKTKDIKKKVLWFSFWSQDYTDGVLETAYLLFLFLGTCFEYHEKYENLELMASIWMKSDWTWRNIWNFLWCVKQSSIKIMEFNRINSRKFMFDSLFNYQNSVHCFITFFVQKLIKILTLNNFSTFGLIWSQLLSFHTFANASFPRHLWTISIFSLVQLCALYRNAKTRTTCVSIKVRYCNRNTTLLSQICRKRHLSILVFYWSKDFWLFMHQV